MKTIPCIARCSDGAPCGRRIPPGTTPQVCHIHKAQAAGANNGRAFQRTAQTPEQVLDELMHSKDETIRFRAADAFLKRQERQTACPKCQAERERNEETSSAINRMTYEQRCQVKELMHTIRDIAAVARTQPLTWDHERQQFTDEPEPPPIVAPAVVAAPPVFEEEEFDGEEDEAEVEEDDRDPLTIPPDEV